MAEMSREEVFSLLRDRREDPERDHLALAGDLPLEDRLLDIVREIAKKHAPEHRQFTRRTHGDVCRECRRRWPCWHFALIESKLRGLR